MIDVIDILFPIDDLDAARLDNIVTRTLVDTPEPRIRSAVRSLDFNPLFVAVQLRQRQGKNAGRPSLPLC